MYTVADRGIKRGSHMDTKRALILTLTFAMLSCHTTSQKEGENGNWSGQMQNMAQDVKSLLPFLYDRNAYEDPKNHETISHFMAN